VVGGKECIFGVNGRWAWKAFGLGMFEYVNDGLNIRWWGLNIRSISWRELLACLVPDFSVHSLAPVHSLP
jgi:hypothetical protein